jgi:hypothetical protein
MLETMMETILWGILALLAAMYLIAPVALQRTFRFSVHSQPRLLPVQEIKPELEQRIEAIAPQLENLGFLYLGCYDFGEPSAHTQTLLALFHNPNTNDFADLTVSSTSSHTDSYLELSTEFASGLRLETNNNCVLPLTPDPKETLVFRFAEIRDPRELYRLHRQLLEKYAARSWAKPEAKGQEISRWVRTIDNYGPRHVELGYMKTARESGQYELTWKGAALMAWKSMLPAVLVRHLRHRAAMNAELRSLELRGVATLQKA